MVSRPLIVLYIRLSTYYENYHQLTFETFRPRFSRFDVILRRLDEITLSHDHDQRRTQEKISEGGGEV